MVVLVAVSLAGCLGGEDTDPVVDDPGQDHQPETTDETGSAGLSRLRFVAENRSRAQETITVTVNPEDALLPLGGPLHMATGGEMPFIKEIDVSGLIPEGTHAHLQATATWDRTLPFFIGGPMNLQWFSFDIWTSGVIRTAEEGEAYLESYVTNPNPGPVNMILVVVEPERMHEPVDVEIDIQVEYLDDAIHRTHVVAADLEGGAVPVTVDLDDETEAFLHVRGPDAHEVLTAQVDNEETVHLPTESPRGEYLFTFFGTNRPAGLMIPSDNLSSPLMRAVDTSLRLGDGEPVPAMDTMSWTEQLDSPPYALGVLFDGLDGRSYWMEANVTVTAPDGTPVIEAEVYCQVCTYSMGGTGSPLAHPAMTAGEYTFTVETGIAQGFQVIGWISTYGR